MIVDFQWNLQQVVDGIPRGTLAERARRSFLYPHDNIWPDDDDQFVPMANKIQAHLNEEQQPLFLFACLACYLLNPDKAPHSFTAWFHSKTALADLLGYDSTWEEFHSWRWGRAAIPLADPMEGWRDRVVYAIVGYSIGASTVLFPEQARRCLNREAQTSVEIAAELAARNHPESRFFFLPMIDPSNPSCTINGRSLGLPVYLAFKSLAAGNEIPAILATGALDRNGTLREVTYLEDKLGIAHKKGFVSFVYPLLDGVKRLDSTDKVNAIGVQTLEEAEYIFVGKNVPESKRPATTRGPLDTVASEVQSFREKLDDLKEISSATSEIKRSLGHNKLQAIGGIFAIAVLMLVVTTTFQSRNKSASVKDAVPNADGEKAIKGVAPVPRASSGHIYPVKISPQVIRENTNVASNQQQAIAKAFNDLNSAIDNRLISENDDNATTASCFRVAKEMMLKGNVLSSRKKYEECFKQNVTYLDTQLDYQRILKGIEGFEGARSTYKSLMEANNSTTAIFVYLLFEDTKARYLHIKKFVDNNPEYSPALYWLGMDCYDFYGKDAGCSDIIRRFIQTAKAGKSDKFFLNRQIVKTMITESEEKLGLKE